jgi:hypothetical protein
VSKRIYLKITLIFLKRKNLGRVETCYVLHFWFSQAHLLSTVHGFPFYKLKLLSLSRDYVLLWNLKVYYHVHKSPQIDPILRQLNPVYIFTPDVYVAHFYIILTYMLRSLKWTLHLRFLTNILYACFISYILFHLVTLLLRDKKKVWRSSVFNSNLCLM